MVLLLLVFLDPKHIFFTYKKLNVFPIPALWCKHRLISGIQMCPFCINILPLIKLHYSKKGKVQRFLHDFNAKPQKVQTLCESNFRWVSCGLLYLTLSWYLSSRQKALELGSMSHFLKSYQASILSSKTALLWQGHKIINAELLTRTYFQILRLIFRLL